MPQLPRHLYGGRSQFPSPVTGNYISFNFGALNLAVASAAPDVIRAGLVMPFAMRLVCVSYRATSVAANVSLQLYSHASAFTIAGGTTLLSTAADVDGDSINRVEPTGSTPTLVAAARDLARGARVFLAITTDAGGTYTDLTVCLQGYVTGVVAHDPAND